MKIKMNGLQRTHDHVTKINKRDPCSLLRQQSQFKTWQKSAPIILTSPVSSNYERKCCFDLL
uniref:Uncharacterized protein n=1 Tax=Arundo donax TaxID=35708 RepID=A0A0A9BEC1_ARUDO